MGEAKRRKQRGDYPAPTHPGLDQRVILKNPVADHFSAFIFGNATAWEQMAIERWEATEPGSLAAFEAEHAALSRTDLMAAFRKAMREKGIDLGVCEQDAGAGKHLVICGAGPSLRDHAAEWCPKADHLWGCNSALTWLVAQGYRPTHGFSVDQTTEMLNEWRTVPDVEYLVATTVHPHLVEFLMGRRRPVRFFHNYVGIQNRKPVDCGHGEVMAYEDWLYALLYPVTVRTGSGLNSVNRAIDLALFMGYETITVLGADCALRFRSPPVGASGSPEQIQWLRDEVEMHADGGNALASNATPLTLSGWLCSEPACEVKGKCEQHPTRLWITKPDMMISAVWLEKARQKSEGKIALIGDTLPNALRGKSDAYLKNHLPALVDRNDQPLAIG